MANFVYNRGAYVIAKYDVESVTWGVMLMKNSYSPDRDHDYVDDISADECDATNYVRKAIANPAISVDDANDRIEIDSDNPTTWTSLGGAVDNTLGGFVIYRNSGADATSELVAWIDTVTGTPDFDFVTQGGDFSIEFGADGWIWGNTT